MSQYNIIVDDVEAPNPIGIIKVMYGYDRPLHSYFLTANMNSGDMEVLRPQLRDLLKQWPFNAQNVRLNKSSVVLYAGHTAPNSLVIAVFRFFGIHRVASSHYNKLSGDLPF